jgi:hypothetical protein
VLKMRKRTATGRHLFQATSSSFRPSICFSCSCTYLLSSYPTTSPSLFFTLFSKVLAAFVQNLGCRYYISQASMLALVPALHLTRVWSFLLHIARWGAFTVISVFLCLTPGTRKEYWANSSWPLQCVIGLVSCLQRLIVGLSSASSLV